MVGFSCLETGKLGSYDGYKAVKCGHVRSTQCACFCIYALHYNTSDLKQSNMLLAAAAFVLTQVHTVKKTARSAMVMVFKFENI